MRLNPLIAISAASAMCLLLVHLLFGQVEQTSPAPAAATIYDTEVHQLASSFVDQEYRLSVALPRGYGESEERYPVLYVLDADILFGTVTETARLLTLEGFFIGEQSVPGLIVVGIGYPGGFDEMAEKRGRDLTPVDASEDAGSEDADSEDAGSEDADSEDSADFFRFLAEQALPFIDGAYQTQPNDRALLGTSTAGLFVLDTLLTSPGTFQRYIATSPRMDEIIFHHEADYAEHHDDLTAVLYLSAGTEGEIEQQIAAGVERFRTSLGGRQYSGLELLHESLEGENHVSAQPTAFTHGLKAVYSQPLPAPLPPQP